MKKFVFTVMAVAAVTLALSATAYSWQGRMGGMGDPYGLTIDDSDFLIHPALITRGEGLDVYSHFNFTYTDISKWDIDLDLGTWNETFDSSGDQFDYGALLGTAFDLGPGRMGIFFAYEGMNRDIDGDADYDNSATDSSTSADYDLKSDSNDFSLRIIYGLPIDVNCLNVGAEAKISYIDEKQSNEWENNDGASFLNHPMASLEYWWEANTLWFQAPYESDYWDAQFKASANGQICFDSMSPIDVTLTLNGGFIFSGDNEYQYDAKYPGFERACVDADGDVDGYNLGGELWVRFPVDDDFSIPFLVRAQFHQKTRDGNGTFHDPDDLFQYGIDGFGVSFEQKEESFVIETGGGLDMKLTNNSQMAAGVFYTFINSTSDFDITLDDPSTPYTGTYEDKAPDYREHRVSLKMGWEKSLSDATLIRAGFNTFFGFIDKDFVYSYNDILGFYEHDTGKLDGHQWGIMASFGSSIKLSSIILEPYINAGYKDLDLDGDLDIEAVLPSTGGSASGDIDEDRQEWFVGAGLSVLFGN